MTRDGGENGSPEWPIPAPRWAALVAAVLVLVVVPLVPAALASGSPAALIALPAESIVVLALLCLMPWRPARGILATAFGLVVVGAIALAAIDAGYRSVLDIPFDPLDWNQLDDAVGFAEGAIGSGVVRGLLAVLVILAVGLVVALAWAALRTARELRLGARGPVVISTVALAWVVAAIGGSVIGAGPWGPAGSSVPPAAAAASARAIGDSVARAADGLAAQDEIRRAIATDPYRDVRGSELLDALAGKDVVFAFVESYGEVAIDGSGISDGVRRVLREGEARLRADGFSSQSATLTSPTFGGLSWLAHSTLQTGLWIDRQPLYSTVIRSDRFTLSQAFARAGWRTVAVVPSNSEPWPFGTSFYHWDAMRDANNVGYRGPSFGYARIPDQYTWKHFADEELGGDRPVMAEIDLASSHTPWAPLPELVPWSRVGDGSVFRAQAARGESAAEVWQDPDQVRQAYGRSIEYALGAMFDFVHETDDPNLVLIVLGDHQPAPIVSGANAGRDVPISIIAKDPAVFAAIEDWGWQDGMLPARDAPVWRMDAFRDRFLAAFSAG